MRALDLGHTQQHRAESALDRRADAALFESESRVTHGGIDHLVTGEGTERQVVEGDIPLGRDLVEGLAAIDLGLGGLRLLFAGEGDLLDGAGLDGGEALGLRRVVARLGLVVGDLGGVGQRLGRDRENVGRAEFRRAEGGLAVVEEALELVLGRGRDLAGGARRHPGEGDRALLVAQPVADFLQGERGGEAADDHLRELLAQDGRALEGDIALLGVAVRAQQFVEPGRGELAGGVAEDLVVEDQVADGLVGDREAHALRRLVQRRLGEQAREHLPVEAERARHLRRDLPALLADQVLDLVLIGGAHLLEADLGRADLGHLVAAIAAEDVAHAPDRKGHDEEAEHDRDDELPEETLTRLADALHHHGSCLSLNLFVARKRARARICRRCL